MNLSRYEQETIIRYNEDEKTAVVDTCNPALIRKLDALATTSADITLMRQDKYGKAYTCPKKWIKVQATRRLSDEEKQKVVARLSSAGAK